MKSKLSPKHIIRLIVLLILFVFGCLVTYKTTIVTRMPRPHLFTIVKAEYAETENGKEHVSVPLENGKIYSQTFTYTEEYLISAGTTVLLSEEVPHEGNVIAELYDNETGELLGSAEYDLSLVVNKQMLMVSIGGRVPGFMNRELEYRLTVSNLGENEVRVYVPKGGEGLYIVAADRQLTYWKYLFVIGAAGLLFVMLFTYYGFAFGKLRYESVFLVTGAVLAFMMLVMLPPASVPDELDHMISAYEKVNELYGLDTESPETAYLEMADYEAMQDFEATPTMTELDTIKNELLTADREEGSTIVSHTNMRAPLLGYLPGVIAILTARALNLNGYMLWMLGRVVAIIFYLFFMYLAIKIIPFGKAAMFIIALLPMTIQQCCSYSYDGLLIECTCIIVAVLTKAMYQKEEKMKKYEIVVLVYACLMTALCKGGCYMPLVLLVLFVPSERFATKKKAWIAKLGLIGITGFAWLGRTFSYVLYVLAPTGTESTTLSYTDAEAYTVSDIFHNLWLFILPAARTAINDCGGYFLSMFGTQLGWLDINVTYWMPVLMFVMILIALIPLEDHENEGIISAPYKGFIFLCCMITVGLVFMSMFLDWTPKQSLFIWGIQGRYFLPLLPALMLLFRSKHMVLKKNFDKYLIFIAVSFQCIVFYDILIALEDYLL